MSRLIFSNFYEVPVHTIDEKNMFYIFYKSLKNMFFCFFIFSMFFCTF